MKNIVAALLLTALTAFGADKYYTFNIGNGTGYPLGIAASGNTNLSAPNVVETHGQTTPIIQVHYAITNAAGVGGTNLSLILIADQSVDGVYWSTDKGGRIKWLLNNATVSSNEPVTFFTNTTLNAECRYLRFLSLSNAHAANGVLVSNLCLQFYYTP